LSIRSAILFLPSGKASPFLLAQWRQRGPLAPIQASAILADGGLATAYFRSLWRAAFPIRPALPPGKVANPDGTGSDDFWNVFS
jgi:hypothetical protein